MGLRRVLSVEVRSPWIGFLGLTLGLAGMTFFSNGLRSIAFATANFLGLQSIGPTATIVMYIFRLVWFVVWTVGGVALSMTVAGRIRRSYSSAQRQPSESARGGFAKLRPPTIGFLVIVLTMVGMLSPFLGLLKFFFAVSVIDVLCFLGLCLSVSDAGVEPLAALVLYVAFVFWEVSWAVGGIALAMAVTHRVRQPM